jgi:hypothetical protein
MHIKFDEFDAAVGDISGVSSTASVFCRRYSVFVRKVARLSEQLFDMSSQLFSSIIKAYIVITMLFQLQFLPHNFLVQFPSDQLQSPRH